MKSYSPYWYSQNKIIIISYIIILFHLTDLFSFESDEDKIARARHLFYQSVENPQIIEKAITIFKEIRKNRLYEGLALTYIGALIALKGKFAFLPITKYRYVLNGLHLMDQGILKCFNNIEARFIRGMTCHYLPFFFKRKKTARNDFKIVVKLLKANYSQYDSKTIMNISAFLLENTELNAEEIMIVKNIQNVIKKNEG